MKELNVTLRDDSSDYLYSIEDVSRALRQDGPVQILEGSGDVIGIIQLLAETPRSTSKGSSLLRRKSDAA